MTPLVTHAPRVSFASTVAVIDDDTVARMTDSWRPGCPVAIEDLRLVTLSHWGFDASVHRGQLVVHADVATDVAQVFEILFEARFPIRRMDLIDAYGGSDDRSTLANNTSAFNCRAKAGGTGWSQHAYGTAIDINPLQNPYVSRGRILDPNAARYADRSLREPGMIYKGDQVVQAFAAIGWAWGGSWSEPLDYQHFSRSGR